MSEIRIVHTSDFHDRLTPQKAARLRALKEAHDALLIDTGDAIRAPNVAVMPWRERAISLMNEAGYDAMGLGNREYFFRAGGMQWKTGHASFPLICSNLRAKRGEPEGVAPLGTLQTPQGIRVGLLALMPTMIEPGHWFERLSDVLFREWQAAAAAAASGLAGKADVVVASFHRPEEEIDALTTLCPDIGLILLGHAHGTPGPLERRADGVVVSRVGERARHARLIGLHADDRSVTMDKLIELDSPDAAGTGQ